MKKKILVLIAGLFLISLNAFATDVSIDSSGNVSTGVINTNGHLEVSGSSGKNSIVGSANGTGAAGVYGINTTNNNYGLLGYDSYGIFGYSLGGYAGYFQGNARVTGNLIVDGTFAAPGVGDITEVNAGVGLTGGATSGAATLNADTTYLQRRVSSSCTIGSSIRAINEDGTVVCQTDNVGITSETDPEVGSNSLNYIPKWDGSALVTGTIYDNGNIGIGTATPSQKLDLIGNLGLENTTSSNTGVIYKGSNRFIHNFQHPTGGTAIPAGQNTFVGINAGNFTMGSTAASSEDSSYNIGVGNNALSSLTTGFRNVAIGFNTLASNTTGFRNVAIGDEALRFTTAWHNTAVGFESLYSNITGFTNVAVGMLSLYYNNSGYYNTAVGANTLYQNSNGTYNTGIGYTAFRYNYLGSYNIAIGAWAGNLLSDGTTQNTRSDNSIYLGSYTKASAINNVNEIVIGDTAIGAGSNSVVLGNDNITKTVLKGSVGIGTTSPQGTLDVNGSIYQRGILLHADYVFSADYNLESIEEHSEFMWKEKHLKAIPKAKVDEKNIT